ncbi:tyrosine-type recombinase/integrase [Acidithiobacillus sulfuriphilus]|uniref:DUF4102 domain-containing protein n=2 Tax=Acidithiobacillus sulfuriphilus TaxID=1867749 RepID=A0A3M8RLW6_9PROT|nr:integrase arm-type DNA-binding domain-containing protein [Acidithiobacillus sulfuriphilus]RNF68134.1 DUF4102 domain-containing protein [Acidithiobacillus sulfuriphilus]
MTLSDTKIKALKPREKAYKASDEKWLYLYVTPAGGKLWRMSYRFEGKEKTMSFGKYPDVSLAMARERRDEARRQIAEGIDPAARKKAERQAAENTFEAVGREWLEKQRAVLESSTMTIIEARLRLYVYPALGPMEVGAVRPADVLRIAQKLEKRGLFDTAHRVVRLIGQIGRYAVATLRAETDPTAALKGAITPYRTKHRAAILDVEALRNFLRNVDTYRGSPIVRAALWLQVLWFVRPGELRHAEWSEFDFDSMIWNVPAGKMKMREAHMVPLATHTKAILESLGRVTGGGRYLFPSLRSADRPISENAVLVALRSMGYEKEQVTGHGFRATARTFLDENLGFRPEVIEMQLAHSVRDPLGRAYNRTQYLQERHRMMQGWADWLAELYGGEIGKL